MTRITCGAPRQPLRWGVLLFTLFAGVVLLQACANQQRRVVPPVRSVVETGVVTPASAPPHAPSLKVMTLNMAHSRGEGFHQLLQRSATARDNLDAIVDLLAQYDPELVALQEADAASFWSGGFNHVAYLAGNSGLSYYVQSENAQGLGLSYGTALLSDLVLQEAVAVTFRSGLPPTPKGFVVSAIDWPGVPSLQVDVVSLHLDPFRESTRRRQALDLIETLRDRKRPLIIMGDLNTEWTSKNSSVKFIAEALGLEACNPEMSGMSTFPAFEKRLDWILLSSELAFVAYETTPNPVSDHRAVVALIALADAEGAHRSECTAVPGGPG